MSPLDTTLANALRVKLGRGRELPEEPKPKRAAKPKDVAATDGAPATKKAPARSKKVAEIALEEPPAEIKPAATIVKPKPAPEIAPEPPLVATLEPEIAPEPSVVPPRRPAAPSAPAAAAAAAVETTAPPAEVKRELIRVPESVTVSELAEKMRRKSGEVIKALLELGVMATVNELLDPTAAKLVA